jgi:L-threonylcarbamoyladenylate synthase
VDAHWKAGESTAADDTEKRVVVLKSSAPRAIEWTAERIGSGGVVALPTDTVYGIAASLSHPAALRRLFAVKGRPYDRPLPVLVSSPAMLEHIAQDLSHDVALLLDIYWPGPLTVVVPARAGTPKEVTAGGTTIGVRMPNHPLAIEVIAKAGGAVACTSANKSDDPPARDAGEVAAAIGPELDLILDGGAAPGGTVSTVVAIEGERLTVLREGALPSEQIQAAWAELLAAHRGNATP